MEVIEKIKYLEDRKKFISSCLEFTLYHYDDFWIHKDGIQPFRTELDRRVKSSKNPNMKFKVTKAEVEGENKKKDYILYTICRIG